MIKTTSVPARQTLTRAVALTVALATFAACRSIVPLPSPWATYISTKQPSSVWLTRANHSVLRVDGPRVFHDTVVGAVEGRYTEVPLSDVIRVSAEQKDKTKTILAAALGGVATVGALIVIFQGQGGATATTPTGVGGTCDPDTPCGPGGGS